MFPAAPAGNAPVGNVPTGNAPAGNAPVGNTPVGNAPLSSLTSNFVKTATILITMYMQELQSPTMILQMVPMIFLTTLFCGECKVYQNDYCKLFYTD